MGYKFNILYRRGNENVVADALSRIHVETEDNDSILKFNNQSMLIQTRNQKRIEQEQEKVNETTEVENEISNQDTSKNNQRPPEGTNKQVQKDEEKITRSINDFLIKEEKDILIQSSEFDHIFFLFSKENCELHKKLQYRLKKTFRINELVSENKIFIFDENRSIVMLNSILRSTIEKERTKSIVNDIAKIGTRP